MKGREFEISKEKRRMIFEIYIYCNFVKFPNSVGIVPENPREERDLFFLKKKRNKHRNLFEKGKKIQVIDSPRRITKNSILTT